MRKQFFRWRTIERAVREYQAHLKTNGIWCGICLQALAWKYGPVFHGAGRGRHGPTFVRALKAVVRERFAQWHGNLDRPVMDEDPDAGGLNGSHGNTRCILCSPL